MAKQPRPRMRLRWVSEGRREHTLWFGDIAVGSVTLNPHEGFAHSFVGTTGVHTSRSALTAKRAVKSYVLGEMARAVAPQKRKRAKRGT